MEYEGSEIYSSFRVSVWVGDLVELVEVVSSQQETKTVRVTVMVDLVEGVEHDDRVMRSAVMRIESKGILSLCGVDVPKAWCVKHEDF